MGFVKIFSLKTSILNSLCEYRLHLGLMIALPYLIWGFAIHWSLLNFNPAYLLSLDQYNTFPLLIYGLMIAVLMGPYFILLNDYFDVPFDILDTKKYQQNPFSKKAYNKKTCFPIFIILAFLISIFGFLTSFIIGLLTVSVIILGTAYSVPPLRLKTVPIVDFLIHGFCLGVYFFILGLNTLNLANSEIFLNPIIFLFMFYSLVDAAWIHLISALKDYNLDKKTRQNTSAVVFGQNKTLILLSILTTMLITVLPIFFFINTSFVHKIGLEYIILVISLIFIVGILFIGKLVQFKGEYEVQRRVNSRFRNIIVYPFALISLIILNIFWSS